ncbi:hypothetical protein GLAREA_01320 [Glarea lozoyensis ATCC 20868]|uniref:Uncharacterized protein n=1 Tax=Glarea lozoyensis (strain ATCC 20868 / MF5171) TaxID=1116229 RepID=S3DFJ1_GLAL2|nr:uncharacterized protein GLAREA_01320 [Glarea lozoyensis ATCC 20868]EPE25408.1 hypothetical protein GLAREA_01320 [Glarea lozoyensis ATCC 20868]
MTGDDASGNRAIGRPRRQDFVAEFMPTESWCFVDIALLDVQNPHQHSYIEPHTFRPQPCFTPVTHKKAPVQYVNPYDTIYYPEEAADFLHNRLEDGSDVFKRGITEERGQTSDMEKDCSYSIGAIWPYADEEDTGMEKELVVEKAAKRQKTATKRGTKGKRAPFKVQTIESDDEDIVGSFCRHRPNLSEPTQSITPPDTANRGKKQAPSKKAKGAGRSLPAFKSLTITKPIQRDEKKFQKSQQNPTEAAPVVVSYQGWSSTESAVKNNAIKIGQTTLDKLAAFRYQAPAQIGQSGNHASFNETSEQLLNNRDTNQIHSIPKPECLLGREDESSQLAGWRIDTGDPFCDQPNIEGIDTHNTSEHPGLTGNRFGLGLSQVSTDIVTGYQPEDRQYATKADSQVGCMPSGSSSFFPYYTSSEQRVLDGLLSVVETAREDGETIQEASQRLKIPPVISHSLGMMMGEMISSDAAFVDANHAEEQCVTPLVRPDSEVHSDGHHSVQESISPANAAESDDEFDDGVDDTDLLAASNCIPMDGSEPNNCSPTPVFLRSNQAPHVRQMQMTKKIPAHDEATSSSPSLLESDPDLDNFAMCYAGEKDQDDTKKDGEAVERFRAPSSVQRSFLGKTSEAEVYDSTLQFSPPPSRTCSTKPQTSPGTHNANSCSQSQAMTSLSVGRGTHPSSEDWSFINGSGLDEQETIEEPKPTQNVEHNSDGVSQNQDTNLRTKADVVVLDDIDECKPFERFVRPAFPSLVRDRSPIIGVSPQTFLRVCFRIYEMYREGARCFQSNQDAIIELFARVTFSLRDPGTTKQHFQFADLWSKHPPFATGILTDIKPTTLADTESKGLVGGDLGKKVRCLGRLKKDAKTSSGWLLHIINIRQTDWEEIRWTKRIVSQEVDEDSD